MSSYAASYSYELLGLSVKKLELTKLTEGRDFFSVNNFKHIFLSPQTALQEIDRLGIEGKVKLKRYPFSVQLVPNRETYIGEEVSLEQLKEDAKGA